MNKKLYGLTDDYYLVVIEDVCKCIECKKRGMYEAQIYKLYSKEFYDSVRLDRLNECLVYVSDDVEKVKQKVRKLSKMEKYEFIFNHQNICVHPIIRSCFRELMGEYSNVLKQWKEIENLYFHPRAYTFKELKPGMWVWDEKYEMMILITFIDKQFKKFHFCLTEYDGFNDEYVNVEYTEYFEEGRFYPVTKCWHEEVKPWSTS